MKTRIIFGAIAFLLVLGILPLAALAADTSPGNGYNDHDEAKLKAFLDQTCADGTRTNGLKLNSSYDPDDPSTYGGITWCDDGSEKHLQTIDYTRRFLAGDLDLSGCSELVYLSCYDNQLTSLNVSGNPALTELQCSYNDLTSLDVSGNPALERLDCSENKLTSLDVSGNPALTHLQCSNNDLTSLDVSGNPALEKLYCSENKLTSLDIGENSVLEKLYCSENKLTSLDVSGCSELVSLDCYTNQLTSLDVSGCSELEFLYCYDNQLTSLDVSVCSELTNLNCKLNNLTFLDVSGRSTLTTLKCSENNLTSLDVSGCSELEFLYCYDNQLTSLDVSGCSELVSLDCYTNQLTSLDVSGCSEQIIHLDCTDNSLKQIDAVVEGGKVSVTAAGHGYIELYFAVYRSYYVTSAPVAPASFVEWKDSGTQVSTSAQYDLTPGSNYDLTAYFDQCLVTFDKNGGDRDADPASALTDFGGKASAPATDPAKDGYAFGGWYKEAACTNAWDFDNDTLTDSTVLYARWTPNTYTVAYDANGGSGTTASGSHTYDVSKTLTANGFTRTGCTFAGWATSADGDVVYTDGQSVKNLTPADGATVTLFARWTANTYTVAYDANGGSGTTASGSHTYDVSKTLTANGFRRTGYTFAGWATSADGDVAYTDGQSVKNLTSTDGATVTLFARWTLHPELSSSVSGGSIYVGGRITLTPSVDGGTWDWDRDFFSATFNSPATFTALKAGTSTITYTVEGVTTSYEVTVEQSGLPSTGQDFTWVWVLVGLAALALAGAAVFGMMRKRNRV